jgi:hypothetical protein
MIMYVGENPSGAVCVPGWMRKGVLKRERERETLVRAYEGWRVGCLVS